MLAEGRIVEDLGVQLFVIRQHEIQAEQLRFRHRAAQKSGTESQLDGTILNLVVDIRQTTQLPIGVEPDLDLAVGFFTDQFGKFFAVFILHTAFYLFQTKTPGRDFR